MPSQSTIYILKLQYCKLLCKQHVYDNHHKCQQRSSYAFFGRLNAMAKRNSTFLTELINDHPNWSLEFFPVHRICWWTNSCTYVMDRRADCSEHNNNDTSCVDIFAWYVWDWQGGTIINLNKKCAAHWHLRLPFTLFSRLYLNSRKWKVFDYNLKLLIVFNMAVSLFSQEIIQHQMLILKRWKSAFICSWWNETVL